MLEEVCSDRHPVHDTIIADSTLPVFCNSGRHIASSANTEVIEHRRLVRLQRPRRRVPYRQCILEDVLDALLVCLVNDLNLRLIKTLWELLLEEPCHEVLG